MLKLAEINNKKELENFLKDFPLGVRVLCYIEAYGFNCGFLNVWVGYSDKEITSVFCDFEGSATLCVSEKADFEELSCFLSGDGFSSLCADTETFRLLSIRPHDTKQMFEYLPNSFISFESAGNTESLREVYTLISKEIPGSFSNDESSYLHFLSDFTFRQRRGLARLKSVTNNNQLVACAMTAAESSYSALISGVASNSDMRGKGLGKSVVLTLAEELKNEGKTVFVIALNKSAEAFYQKIGFKKSICVGYLNK